jgi:hypothetical protein
MSVLLPPPSMASSRSGEVMSGRELCSWFFFSREEVLPPPLLTLLVVIRQIQTEIQGASELGQ